MHRHISTDPRTEEEARLLMTSLSQLMFEHEIRRVNRVLAAAGAGAAIVFSNAAYFAQGPGHPTTYTFAIGAFALALFLAFLADLRLFRHLEERRIRGKLQQAAVARNLVELELQSPEFSIRLGQAALTCLFVGVAMVLGATIAIEFQTTPVPELFFTLPESSPDLD